MGCDIHFQLERAVRRPDHATVRARVLAMMLAKRAAAEQRKPDEAAEEPRAEDAMEVDAGLGEYMLPPELWERVAQMVPATLDTTWVQCPFLDWATAATKAFPAMHAEYASVVEQAEMRVKATLAEEGHDDDDYYIEYFGESMREVMEQIDSKMTYAFQDLDIGRRNYNAFALFGCGARAHPDLKIKMLGCVREGWPLDLAKPLFEEPFGDLFSLDSDSDLHSHHYVTLEGLMSVDWDAPATSTLDNGRRLRPKGPVKFGSGKTTAAQWQHMLQYLLNYDTEEEKKKRHSTYLYSHMGAEDFPFLIGMSDDVKAQLTRGCEAIIAREDEEDDLPEPEDETDEDVRLFRTHLEKLDEHQSRRTLMLMSRGSPEVVPPTEKTRRQILEVGYSDVDVYEQLRALEAKIIQGGAELSDLRLIIAFDN